MTETNSWLLSEPCIIEWRIVSILVLIVLFPIVILGVVRDGKDWKEGRNKEKCSFSLQCFVRIAPWLTIIFFVVNIIFSFLIVWGLIPESFNCQIVARMHVWSIHISLISLYALMILRSHVAYHGSMFEYPKWFMLLLCFFTLIIIGCSFYWDFTSITHIRFYQTIDNKLVYFCLPAGSHYVVYVALCIQATMTIVGLTVFIRPLLKLNDSRPNNELEGLIVRTGTLFSIALISTTITLLIITEYSGMEVRMIDAATNIICVILMQASMKSYFDIFCGKKGYCCCCKYTTNKVSSILDERSKTKSSTYNLSVQLGDMSPASSPRPGQTAESDISSLATAPI